SGAVVVAVGPPHGRELISRATLGATALAILGVASRAHLGVDLGAMAQIGGARGLLDAQRAGADELRSILDAGREPLHVGQEGFHLVTVERNRMPIHAAFQTTVDANRETHDLPFPPAILRELSRDADQRHRVGLRAALEMAALAIEIVAGKAP